MCRLIRAGSLISVCIFSLNVSLFCAANPILINTLQQSVTMSDSVEESSKNNISWNLWKILPIGDSVSPSSNGSKNAAEDSHFETKFQWSSLFNSFLKSFYKQPSRKMTISGNKKYEKLLKARLSPHFLFKKRGSSNNHISIEQHKTRITEDDWSSLISANRIIEDSASKSRE